MTKYDKNPCESIVDVCGCVDIGASGAILNISRDKNIEKNPRYFTDFNTKIEAINYIKKFPENNLYLFSEDRSAKLNKLFYTMTHENVYKVSKHKKFHFYECYERNELVKLHIDLDIKKEKIPKDAIRDSLFKSTILYAITSINKELEKYDIINPEIIILSSSRENKLSAHIIYKNVVFDDIYKMKIFMSDIKCTLVRENIIDLNIYKVGSFRLLWNSKFGMGNKLEYFDSVNYKYDNDDKKLFMDCLLKNIPMDYHLVKINIPENIKLNVKKSNTKSNTKSDTLKDNLCNVLNHNIPITKLRKYVDLLSIDRANNYGEWINVGMILYNCNQSKESFKLWDYFSRKSDKYDGEQFLIYKWNSFKLCNLGFGSLKYYAKNDNPEKYDELENYVEKELFKSVKFNQNYLLLNQNAVLKNNKCLISKEVNKWLNRGRILVIKSPYDTGKTKLILKILEEYGNKLQRILIVSYRQSLTNEFYGNFSKFGFANYMDGSYFSDRLICQIESLHRLCDKPIYSFEDGSMSSDIPSYDLIIMDEIESILNHFQSSTIKEREKTFNLLKDIIYNSDKVLALDGDFNNRGYEFLSGLECIDNEKMIILENEIKKNKKHFIFLNNKEYFDNLIDVDLKNKLNVVIVSMSATIANDYYNRYKDNFKCVLHCARSDDELKEKIQDVNNFWDKYNLVSYSPSIVAGVNFDKEHFDKIYVVVTDNSCCPRDLCQMIARIRKVKDSNICVYLNRMPYKEKANFYTYDETREYVFNLCSKYLECKSFLDPKTNKMKLSYKIGLYTNILIYNEMEYLNKRSYYFMPYFIKLIKDKGHTYELKNIEEHNKDDNVENNIFIDKLNVKDELANAEDITDNEFKNLLMLQNNNKATRNDKLMIEKHMYKKNWGVDKIDREFLEKYYGKTYILFNLKYLLNKIEINPYLTIDETDDKVINFNKIKKQEQVNIIKDVIKTLGFEDFDKKKILVSKENFETAKNKLVSGCSLFTMPEVNLPLFRLDKCKISSMKSFLGFLNSLLKNWGLNIESKQKSIRYNNIIKNMNYYVISFIDDINKYL